MYRKSSFTLPWENVQFRMGMPELIFHDKLGEKGVGFYQKKTKKNAQKNKKKYLKIKKNIQKMYNNYFNVEIYFL